MAWFVWYWTYEKMRWRIGSDDLDDDGFMYKSRRFCAVFDPSRCCTLVRHPGPRSKVEERSTLVNPLMIPNHRLQYKSLDADVYGSNMLDSMLSTNFYFLWLTDTSAITKNIILSWRLRYLPTLWHTLYWNSHMIYGLPYGLFPGPRSLSRTKAECTTLRHVQATTRVSPTGVTQNHQP